MFARRGHILLSAEATVSGLDRLATAQGRLLMRVQVQHKVPPSAIGIFRQDMGWALNVKGRWLKA